MGLLGINKLDILAIEVWNCYLALAMYAADGSLVISERLRKKKGTTNIRFVSFGKEFKGRSSL
jgi:hypothetical protein